MNVKPPRWAWSQAGLEPKFQSATRGLRLLLPFWGSETNLTTTATDVLDGFTFDRNATWRADVSNAPNQELTDKGPAARFTSTERAFRILGDSLENLSSGNTLLILLRMDDTSFATNKHIFQYGSSQAGTIALFRSSSSPTNGWRYQVRDSGGTGISADSGDNVANDGEWHLVIGRSGINGGGGGTGNTQLWIDGQQEGNNASPTTWQIDQGYPIVGGHPTVTQFLENADMALLALWDRAVSYGELQMLSNDPYGLIRPARRRASVGVVTILLQAAPAAEAGVTANLETLALLEATPAGQSAVSAAFTIITQLAADIAAIGSVSGTLTTAAENLLAAIAAGSSTVTADLQTLAELQATPAGQAAVSAILALVKELESNPAAAASITAGLTSTVTVSKGFTALSEALATTITISDE